MEGTQNRQTDLNTIRRRLLSVNDRERLICALEEIGNIPVALSTTEDVTDGTGLSMSFSVICTGVSVTNGVMCLTGDDGFTTVQLNLDTVRRVHSRPSVTAGGVSMKLSLKNGAEFLLMFHLEEQEPAAK